MGEPANIVIDAIQSVAEIDSGNGVCLNTTLQTGGAMRVVVPFTLVPAALLALVVGDDIAREARKSRGAAAQDDIGWALPVSGVHVGMTGDGDHVSLGLSVVPKGVIGFQLDRAEANRLAGLLQKWAASPSGRSSDPSAH